MSKERLSLSSVRFDLKPFPDEIAQLFVWRAGLAELAKSVWARISTVQRLFLEGPMTVGKSTLSGIFAVTGRVPISLDAGESAMRRGFPAAYGEEKFDLTDEVKAIIKAYNRRVVTGFKYPATFEGWGFRDDIPLLTSTDSHVVVLVRPVRDLASRVKQMRTGWVERNTGKSVETVIPDWYRPLAVWAQPRLYGKYSSVWVLGDAPKDNPNKLVLSTLNLLSADEAKNFFNKPEDESLLNTILGKVSK